MAIRLQRNTTNLSSIGFQVAVDEGNNLRVEYILTMLHPHEDGFPHNYTEFKKYVTEKLLNQYQRVKLVCVRDVHNSRNVLVQSDHDYEIMCNTERKEYGRMPVFTIVVELPNKRPIPPQVIDLEALNKKP